MVFACIGLCACLFACLFDFCRAMWVLLVVILLAMLVFCLLI